MKEEKEEKSETPEEGVESVKEVFYRIARDVVPYKDWGSFVLWQEELGGAQQRYPNYVEAINRRMETEMLSNTPFAREAPSYDHKAA